MCEASHWSKLHSYICITCYVLCVFCDVHLHTVEGAASNEPARYDAIVNASDAASRNSTYLLVPTTRLLKNASCKHSVLPLSNASYTPHSDKLMKVISPKNMSEVGLKSSGDGVQSLEKLLKSIGLGEAHIHDDHEGHDHDHDHDHEHGHVHGKYEAKAVKPKTDGVGEVKKSKCLSASDYYDSLRIPKTCSLSRDQFKEICPSMIMQIVDRSCVESTEDVPKIKKKTKSSAGAVWGCSIAAVIVISMVGLVAVALIPLMKKGFYDILVQFLIAVGVGTLVGDAILHLIPHALVPHDHSHEGSGNDKEMQDTVWKTTMALAGIYIFFLTERLTTMIQSYRIRQRIRRRRTRLTEKTSLPRNGVDEGTVAIIQSDSRFATGDRECQTLAKTTGRNSASSVPTEVGSLGDSGFDLGKLVVTDHAHSHGISQRRSDCNVVAEEANRLMHQTPVHHCHSHDFSSIKAIAWTVIMGDGLHNFCDGVAIGAAFTDDLRGGLSTSLAVIWHELPHEIGDFAVLLKAGMSVKMAVFYNILSSIFCFAGMVLGITIGGMHNVTPWIFMLATGMFIYIALVDMLPNLTCDQVDENGQPTIDGTKSHRKLVFLVQNLGILSGYAVMLLIALYEDKILS